MSTAFLKQAVAAALMCMSAICCAPVAADPQNFFDDWRVEEQRGHRLAGKVWSREAGGLVSGEALAGAVQAAPIVLVGEIHDNGDHHRIQAKVLSLILASGRKPAVVFEQFRSNQQQAIDAAQEKGLSTLAALKDAVKWDASGWKSYDYDPLFEAVLAAKLKIYAGDVPRKSMMAVAKQGTASLPDAERNKLALDRGLGSALDEAALEEVYDAHCGVMAKEALSGMAAAQRYRDGQLADVLLGAAEGDGGAVLFAGNGHVRGDRGVPWYLRARTPETPVLTVMPIEVQADEEDPAAYVPRGPDGKPAADFVIFTPRAGRGDPCAELKAKMKR